MDADLPHEEEDVKGLYEEDMAPNLARTSPASSTNHQMPPSSDASTSESPPLGLNLGLDLLQQPNGSYSCVSCHRKFPTAKLLQQHNQSFHSDKHFVCETCGKAFRFRSNLAEHRSVHTALKPFVCRFCGKSSRLKGNLTKHILKHHKKEQNDYIGTDDIIIKKGKKSVKDPAAIDFLEKSMIVLNGGNRTGSAAGSHSGSSTPLPGVSLNAPSIEEQQRCFLMSLGLEPGSIDLKVESPDSDSSMGSQARTMNDQLLEKCNAYAAMETDEPPHHNVAEDLLAQLTGGDSGASAVATLANIVANNNNSINTNGFGLPGSTSTPKLEEGLLNVSSRTSTPISSSTKCPECGKHVRKPKDLITHLTTMHKLSPGEIAAMTGNLNSSSSGISGSFGSSSFTPASNDFGASFLVNEVKQLEKSIAELKGQQKSLGQIAQSIQSLDGRMGRMEKQLEMVLNTLYTLVQLQAGPLAKKASLEST